MRVRYEGGRDRLQVLVKNEGDAELAVSLADNAYEGAGREYRVAAGEERAEVWDVARSDGWYDLSVKCGGDAGFVRRFAGHVEDGRPSRSDPANG